jgi:hypothetical protein
MNSQQKKAKTVLLNFAKSKGHNVKAISHVHAYAFFVGYVAAACGVVKLNWLESEPQVLDNQKKHPLRVITNYQNKYFDNELKEGDACYFGYMSTPTEGTYIACKIPNE